MVSWGILFAIIGNFVFGTGSFVDLDDPSILVRHLIIGSASAVWAVIPSFLPVSTPRGSDDSESKLLNQMKECASEARDTAKLIPMFMIGEIGSIFIAPSSSGVIVCLVGIGTMTSFSFRSFRMRKLIARSLGSLADKSSDLDGPGICDEIG